MIWVFLGAAVVLGGTVWWYLRFGRRVALGPARVAVRTVAESAGALRIEMVLSGTVGPVAFRWLAPPYPPVGGSEALAPPAGFQDREANGGTVWMPVEPVALFPQQAVCLHLDVPPGVSADVVLTGTADPVEAGDPPLTFRVPVRPSAVDPRVVRTARKRIVSEARAQGILPRDHPEWRRLKTLEEGDEAL